jgi:PASTA domain
VAKLSRAHLHVGLRSHYSRAPAGTVIAQSPEPGARVAKDSRVLATLSAGPAPVLVPSVIGFSTADARSSLQQLGLGVSLNPVPAPGVATGTVTAQYPAPGTKRRPGSPVSVSVAEAPRWRTVLSFSDQGGKDSPTFEIRATRWRLVYDMEYDGTCTFIFFCSGPTANVLDLGHGTTVSSFDLNEGSDQAQIIHAGAGTYQVKIVPGDDSASWTARVQDYY